MLKIYLTVFKEYRRAKLIISHVLRYSLYIANSLERFSGRVRSRHQPPLPIRHTPFQPIYIFIQGQLAIEAAVPFLYCLIPSLFEFFFLESSTGYPGKIPPAWFDTPPALPSADRCGSHRGQRGRNIARGNRTLTESISHSVRTSGIVLLLPTT